MRRPSGLADYVLQLSTLPQHNDLGAAGGGDVPRALLFVADTAGPLALEGAMLTHLFGLTAGEARMAVVLGEGMDLTAVASILHISLNTAKTYQKAIYAKTEVNNRQSLMKLLMALAAGRV